MGAAVRPEEAAFSQAFRDVNSHVSLDASWAKVRAAIESHCGLLGKQHAVRVRNWLKKLSEETANLGRADFRRAQYADERALAAAAAAAEDSDDGVGGYNGAGGLKYLPGTRMKLRGAEGRLVDRQQLEDVGWQPSKLELEAQLGASRERQAELEWRLGQLEGLLRRHAALLQGQAAPPLGSLLDAIDDGHVSPPKQRTNKQQLEELIERYEAKKRQWQSPAWSAAAAAGAGAGRGAQRPPPIAPSDEEEVLRQLDNFQRQTDTIRRQLGGAGSDTPAGMPQPAAPGSSLAAHTSNGSDWGALLESTPMRQQPTGLRGGGYTPHAGVAVRSMALFDGLPPSPAALAASRQQPGANRHVHHAGHHLQPSNQQQHVQQAQQQQQQQQQATQQQAASSVSRLAASAAEPMQGRLRSPVGPEIRHTKKSAAAAERASAAAQPSPGAAAALQRLKSKRQTTLGTPLTPDEPPLQQQQQEQEEVERQAATSGSPDQGEQQWQRDVSVQAQGLQHDEGVQVRPAAEAGVQAPTPPAPPQLPPDSNAALVAEVRQLRSKLLASLQKHAPELAAAGVDVGSMSALATAQKRQAEERCLLQEQPADSSWRLAAAPSSANAVEAAAPPALSTHMAASASHSRRLTEPSWGESGSDWLAASSAAASAAAAAGAAAAGVGSSTRFRLTDDLSVGSVPAGGRRRLTDLSTATPSSLLGGGGGGSLLRLDSLEPSSPSLGSLGNVESGFDLGAFEAQTEALRARLAGL